MSAEVWEEDLRARQLAFQVAMGRARVDLTQLPDLYERLDLGLGQAAASESRRVAKVRRSRALINLEVLALTDMRRKDGWHGEDPRLAELDCRYGVVPTLEAWTRVVFEEMPEQVRPELSVFASCRSECSVLIEVWQWIEQQAWAELVAADVSRLARRMRRVLGEDTPEPRYRCPSCNGRAYLRHGDSWLVCAEEAGHEVSVRDFEQQQRRRPPMPTSDITAEFGVHRHQLYRWRKSGRIRPAPGRTGPGPRGGLRWFPWDVLLLLNPAIRDALDAREGSAS